MTISPKQWKAKENCPYVQFEKPESLALKMAVKTCPNGPQLCCGTFQGLVCFIGQIRTVSMPTRFQDKSDAPLSVSITGLEPWIEALEANLKGNPDLQLQTAIRRNVFMESCMRARFGKDLRIFDAKDQRQCKDKLTDLLPGEYEAIGSVSIYSVNGSHGLTVRLHALQPV